MSAIDNSVDVYNYVDQVVRWDAGLLIWHDGLTLQSVIPDLIRDTDRLCLGLKVNLGARCF